MAAIRKQETLSVSSSESVVRIRQAVRAWAIELGFSLVDQTKIVTAASELARNIVDYAGSGTVLLEAVTGETGRQGLRLTFEDHGPGIPDVELALKDGYSTRGGLGLGLGGSRRLMNEFQITSRVGEGTRVVVTKWR
ncbi:MAG: anti-sigma regulatory factor [bacterium]